VPRASCGRAVDCRREEAEGRRFASGRWPGGGLRRGGGWAAECVEGSRRRPDGGVLRPSVVGGREGGGCRRAACNVGRAEGGVWDCGCGGLGGSGGMGDAVRVSQ
jgi:hypothetical protein